MRKVHVRAPIITNYCVLSSLVRPDAVRHSLRSCVSNEFVAYNQSKSLMKPSCDIFLKIKFETLSRTEFWIYIQKEHLELSHSHRSIGTFGTTCLCEETFSAMAPNKPKYS
jgi:hypothetical protein